jgi:hypothetical protein
MPGLPDVKTSKTSTPATTATVALFVLALAWLWLLRGYGFQLEDEGTLLFQFTRVLDGARPYLDFHTGYTPGYFALGRTAMSWFGESALAVRGVMAVINAATAAALFVIARRLAGTWIAPLPALLWLAFVPAYAGEFAAFNIPYPTWPATLAWTLVALAMLGWARRGTLAWVALAGGAAALALASRPDAGAFALAGATWGVAATSDASRPLDRLARLAGAAFMAAGVWYTFQFQVFSVDAFVHLLPTGAMALMAATCSAQGSAARARTAAALTVLAITFLLPTLAWMGPLYVGLGHEKFLFEVLLIGADYQTLYFTAHPMPQLHAGAVALGVLALAMLGRAVRSGAVGGRSAGIAVALAAFVAATVAAFAGLAPEGRLASISSQLENAAYWLALIADFGAVVFLGRRLLAGERRGSRADEPMLTTDLAVVLPLALAMYLQLYPRSDFMHQITAVPLAAVVAALLLDRVTRWWSATGTGLSPLAVRSFVWTLAAAVLLIETLPMAGACLRARLESGSPTALAARVGVRIEAAADDELDELARTVAWLDAHAEADEPVLSFPATSGVLFAAGLTNPSPHDYWFPGRPDHEEEARVLALVAADPPRLVVTINRHWTFFAGAPAWFAQLRGFVVENYGLAFRAGRFDVLARNDLLAAGAVAAEVPQGLFTVARGAGRDAMAVLTEDDARAAAIEPSLAERRQAARRWMRTITPEDAAAASLPDDPRDAVLLLRAIRDGGDLRAAAWAVAGFASAHPRIRGEAVGAMEQIARETEGSRLRLADDFDLAALRPWLAPLAATAQELLPFERTRPFAEILLAATGERADGRRP